MAGALSLKDVAYTLGVAAAVFRFKADRSFEGAAN